MVKRYNTGNQVPSGDPKDFNDNSMDFDAFMNAGESCVYNRVGNRLITIFGIDKLSQEKIADFNAEIDRIIRDAGGVDIVDDWGDSLFKVINQAKISKHLGDNDGGFFISDGDKEWNMPVSEGNILASNSPFMSPNLRCVIPNIEKSVSVVGYIQNPNGNAKLIYREGNKHYPDPDGGKLFIADTKDGLSSFEGCKILIENHSVDHLNAMGSWVGDKYVLVIVDNDGENYGNPYTYTTSDYGETWDKNELLKGDSLPDGFNSLPHGSIYKLKNSGNSYVMFFYSSNIIAICRSDDGGNTWSSIERAVSGSASVPISEMALFQTDSGEYSLVIRQGDLKKALLSFSNDLTSWTLPIESSLDLGANPLYSLSRYNNDYLYVPYRSAVAGSSLRNVITTYKVNPAKLYSERASYNFGSPTIVAQMPHWGIGTSNISTQKDGSPFIIFNAWEHVGNLEGAPQWTQGGAINALYVLSDYAGVESSSVIPLIPKYNMMTNGNLKTWQFGKSGKIGTNKRNTSADCFGVRFTGSTGSGTWSNQNGSLRLALDEGTIDNNHINVMSVIHPSELDQIKGKWCNIQLKYSSPNDSNLEPLIYVMYSEDEDPSIGTDGGVSGGNFIMARSLEFPTISNVSNFNFLTPKNAKTLAVRITLRPIENKTATELDYFDLHEIGITEGGGLSKLIYDDVVVATLRCERFYQKTFDKAVGSSFNSINVFNSVDSAGSITNTQRFTCRMRKEPRVRVMASGSGIVGSVEVIGVGQAPVVTELVTDRSFTIRNPSVINSKTLCRFHWDANAQYW